MAMTTCSRARSHKLRCAATPLAHDYRIQRHTGETRHPDVELVVAYEVRGGRQRRTRLYGPGYQPCPPAKPYTGFGGPASGNGYPATWASEGDVCRTDIGRVARDAEPPYPYNVGWSCAHDEDLCYAEDGKGLAWRMRYTRTPTEPRDPIGAWCGIKPLPTYPYTPCCP